MKYSLYTYIPISQGIPLDVPAIPDVVWVPHEVVVYHPAQITPLQARIYRTNTWLVNGKIIDYKELAKTEGFRGTSHHEEILLVEVWMDNGDDGHVCFSLRGHRAVPEARLKYEREHPRFLIGTLPLCMHWGEGYETEFEVVERMKRTI